MSQEQGSTGSTSALGSDPLATLAAAVKPSAGRESHDLLGGPDWITGRPPPPLAQWNPSHCGDIGMEIREDGSWWHQGAPIKRQELVRLFASILRREEDGEFYLVTPVEKVIVRVALHPLRVIDAEPLQGYTPKTLILTLNTGGQVPLDARHPLALEPRAANAAFVALDNGLTALFTRAAWYRLAELADGNGVLESGACRISLLD